jgi:hypothetical protein
MVVGEVRFQYWPFHQQVPANALATIFYAMDGRSWSDDQNWLTNETECRWSQGSVEDFCGENSILLVLNQSNNTLNGKSRRNRIADFTHLD